MYDRLYLCMTDCIFVWLTLSLYDRMYLYMRDCTLYDREYLCMTDCILVWQTVSLYDILYLWMSGCIFVWKTLSFYERLYLCMTSCMFVYIALQHKPTFWSSGVSKNLNVTGFRVSAFRGNFAKTKAKNLLKVPNRWHQHFSKVWVSTINQ